jgi:hypothetical protein
MKTKRFSVERFVAVLKQLGLGVTAMEVIRKVRSPPFCFRSYTCKVTIAQP